MQIEFTPWQVLERTLLFSASPWFEIWRERVKLPDGRIIPDYYQLVVPDASVVVAVTADRQIVVLRQYKHGTGTTIWGLPAGFCNDDEAPLHCAQRELLEETGWQAEQWIDLGTYVRDANRGAGVVHVFLALQAAQFREPNSDDLEEFQVQCLSMPELLDLIRRRHVKSISVVAAVMLAHLYLQSHEPAG